MSEYLELFRVWRATPKWDCRKAHLMIIGWTLSFITSNLFFPTFFCRQKIMIGLYSGFLKVPDLKCPWIYELFSILGENCRVTIKIFGQNQLPASSKLFGVFLFFRKFLYFLLEIKTHTSFERGGVYILTENFNLNPSMTLSLSDSTKRFENKSPFLVVNGLKNIAGSLLPGA